MEEKLWIAKFSSSGESVSELNLSLQGLQFIYDWQNISSQFWKINPTDIYVDFTHVSQKTQGKRIFPQNAEALWYFEIMISHMWCWLWLLNREFWKCCANSDLRKLGSEISCWDVRVKWLFCKTLKKDWQGSDYSLWCFKDKFKKFRQEGTRVLETFSFAK